MFYVLGFYKFKKLKGLKNDKIILQNKLKNNQVRGTIILSKEGINGTISGKIKNVNKIKSYLINNFNFKNFDSQNNSISKFNPFHRAKVKIKKEVVPIGIQMPPLKNLDNYVAPKNWNKLLKEKNVKIIDARKPFEYKVGTFKGAINPKVDNFREFPKYLKKLDKKKDIAMFCTGGIRCEKASVYLEKNGFNNVYQLKGGIINYLKKIKKNNSLWKGECYVFDNRVSIRHGLLPGNFLMCSGCRKPISNKDKKSRKYEEGVSCPNCYDNLKNSQKERFRMRQKQINIAKEFGKKHIFQKEF